MSSQIVHVERERERERPRQAGIDVLKILSMVLITIIHYCGYSSVYSTQLLAINKTVLLLLSTITLVAVNLFSIITGYLLCDKKTNYIRPFKVWSEGWVYSIGLLVPGLLITKGAISAADVLHVLLPFSSHHYWYLTAGVILYLLCPFYNKIINEISGDELRKALIIVGAFITVFYVSNPFIISDVYIGHPHGIIWLSYLYFLGAFIRKNGCKKKTWLLIGIIAYLVSFALQLHHISYIVKRIQLLSQYAVLPVLLSISIFVLLKDVNFNSKRVGQVISLLAESSFGVYLIQEHNLIRSWYWTVFDAQKYATTPFLLLQLLCAVVILWPCAIIGHKFFKVVYDHFGEKTYSILEKMARKIIVRC